MGCSWRIHLGEVMVENREFEKIEENEYQSKAITTVF
jgi:hypothetical protein